MLFMSKVVESVRTPLRVVPQHRPDHGRRKLRNESLEEMRLRLPLLMLRFIVRFYTIASLTLPKYYSRRIHYVGMAPKFHMSGRSNAPQSDHGVRLQYHMVSCHMTITRPPFID
ncbi:hypothetical protein E4T56_gene4547 [Termitomyces sp. T112]|nr:hypothetical protein E4T56_gene4547 [Termitomyces sp. T112]